MLPQDVQGVQQDRSQNCQLCLAAVTVGEGFLIGSGEVQDLVSCGFEIQCRFPVTVHALYTYFI